MQDLIKQPFTPMQLDLLKMFSRNIGEQELKEIKTLLAGYFAGKAVSAADKMWEDNQWSEKDEEKFLQEHNRTSYKHD